MATTTTPRPAPKGPETPYRRAQRLRQPLPLPDRKRRVRYWTTRTRNGWRRMRRIRGGIAGWAGRAYGWMGTKQSCGICGRMVLIRHMAYHMEMHRTRGDKKPKPNAGKPAGGTGPTGAATPPPPKPRKPSRTKEKAGGGRKAPTPPPPPCGICGHQASSTMAAQVHMANEHRPQQPPPPPSPPPPPPPPNKGGRWRRRRQEEEKAQCSICGREGPADALAIHMQQYHGAQPEDPNPRVTCPICGGSGPASMMQEHMRKAHGQRDGKPPAPGQDGAQNEVVCGTCGNRFPPSAISAHMRHCKQDGGQKKPPPPPPPPPPPGGDPPGAPPSGQQQPPPPGGDSGGDVPDNTNPEGCEGCVEDPPKSKAPDQQGSSGRRRWRKIIDKIGADMAGQNNGGGGNGGKGGGGGGKGSGGGPGASSAAAAFIAGLKTWCDHQPSTVSEMRDHLMSMDAAMGQAGDLVHHFAQTAIVGQKLHPAIAQPIDSAADQLASIRHLFSEAYARFEQIYADRLAYERDSSRPKPGEEFWKDVS